MRSVPALEVRVRRFGVWRLALGALAVTAGAAISAWWATQPQPRAAWTGAVAAGGLLLTVTLLPWIGRQRPLSLRWDRRRWLVATDAADWQSGDLSVALDFGGWLLLHFVPDGEALSTRSRRTLWIGMQRRGLESQWHALRVTLYAARPAKVPRDAGA